MAKRNGKGKKRVAGKVFLVLGIILSMAVGSLAAAAQYNGKRLSSH